MSFKNNRWIYYVINSNIINKQKYEHFISQLIKLFNFNDDLDSFINYLNKINNNNKLNNSIWLFVDRFNLYENLDNALLKILDKLLNKGIIKKHDLLLIDNDYYKNIKYIYKNLNISLGMGSRIILVGSNGCGKTTFFNV